MQILNARFKRAEMTVKRQEVETTLLEPTIADLSRQQVKYNGSPKSKREAQEYNWRKYPG